MRRINGKLIDADRSDALLLLAHNPKVAGSNPAPATNCTGKRRSPVSGDLFVCWAAVNIAARLPLSSIRSWPSCGVKTIAVNQIHGAFLTPPGVCPRAGARRRAPRPCSGQRSAMLGCRKAAADSRPRAASSAPPSGPERVSSSFSSAPDPPSMMASISFFHLASSAPARA